MKNSKYFLDVIKINEKVYKISSEVVRCNAYMMADDRRGRIRYILAKAEPKTFMSSYVVTVCSNVNPAHQRRC